jgi:hypothetical protein
VNSSPPRPGGTPGDGGHSTDAPRLSPPRHAVGYPAGTIRKPRVPPSRMNGYARPSNKSGRFGPTAPNGLDQFRIGLDHNPPGISTESARGPETTGNNRHVSDKRGTRPDWSTPQQIGPSPRYIIGISAGQTNERPAR